MKLQRIQGCLLSAFVLLMTLGAVPASAQEARQYKLEAAFLYNFFNYITWPGYASPEALRDPTICVDGNDPIEPYLAYVQQKMAGQRSLKIRQVSGSGDARGCHILFARGHLPEGAVPPQVLLISGQPGGLDRGSSIELYHQGARMGMKIDNSALSQSGFRVSSRLLNLAQEVR